MSLHVPAGAYILVASVTPIHVQCVLKHCGAHKHNIIIKTRTDPKQS